MVFFYRHAFVMKLTIAFLAGITVMPVIMNLVWQRHSRKILVDQFVKESDRMVEQLNNNVANYFDNIWLGVFETTSSEDVRNILNNQKTETGKEEYTANVTCLESYLGRLHYYNADIFRVTLLTDRYAVDSIGGTVRREETEGEKWYQEFVASDRAVDIWGVRYKDYGTGTKTPTVSYVQKILLSPLNVPAGIVIIDIRYTKIKEMFDQVCDSEQGRLYVFDEDRLIYSPDGFKEAGELTQAEKELLAYADIERLPRRSRLDGQEKILVGKTKIFPGWFIMEAVDRKRLAASADGLFRGLNRVILVTGISFFLLMLFMLWRMLRPLAKIEQKMFQVEHNQFTVRFENPGKDEFGRIESGFNRMISHIEKLLQNIEQEEKEKREMAVKTLRAQINPHFLYNTLNVIRWRAMLDQNREVDSMIVELIRTMEFNGKRKEEFVTIYDETDSVRHYVRLLKYQYNDRFEMLYQLEDEIGDYYICKMILQPLVENAIFHGILPSSRQGVVQLRAEREKDRIRFWVRDNGIGMTGEKEAEIFHGIGVSNVNDRLRYYFGESLQVTNRQGEGVTVSFAIPVLKEIPLDRVVL